MTHINQLLIEGTLIKDAELKYTNSGLPIATFCIANSVWQGKDKEPYVSFINVTVFGKIAEMWINYLLKGVTILATCQAKIEKYKDANGIEKQAFKASVGFGHTIRITMKSKEAEGRLKNVGNNGAAQQQNHQQQQQNGYNTQSQGSQQQNSYQQPQQQQQPAQGMTNQSAFQDDIPF